MGLCELLLQELPRAPELRGEALRDPLERGLRAPFLDLDGQDRLVELRVPGVVQRVLDVRVFQERRDERIDDRVVRVQDLDPDGVFPLLEEAHLHGRVRSGSANLRLCGSPGFVRAVVVKSEDVPERIPDGPCAGSIPLQPNPAGLQEARGLLEVVHMKFKRCSLALGTAGNLRQFRVPPEGELPSGDLHHGPYGVDVPDGTKTQHIAIEGEGFLHVVHRDHDVPDVLDHRHALRIRIPLYEPRPCAVPTTVRRSLNSAKAHRGLPMPAPETPSAETFASAAENLLESIERARKRIEGIAGLVDGTLDRFRERIDRLIRESEVDNWRQVRIFTRDVDTIAADLAKASKEKRLSPRLVAGLDVSLRKARKRDFYGARKAWRKLDKLAGQGAEVRQLQGTYRESYKGVEARIRQLRTQVERLEKIPKPPMSPEDARTFNEDVDAFNEAATAAYLDFLARSRADVAIPLLLEAAQGRGIGVPAPPPNSDPEPLMRLLNNASPQGEAFRSRSFYGLLELPAYSDAKLTHVFGDSRLIRSALEAAC